MAQFTSFPALQARAPDIQGALHQAEQFKSERTLNRLREIKIQQGMGEVERQGQLRSLMPGVGAEAGLGPKAQEVLGLDPGLLDNLMKIPKANRARVKEQVTVLGNLALSVLTTPPVQRAANWPQFREFAIKNGAEPQEIPEVYDQGTEQKLRLWAAQADKIKTLLDQAPDMPSGYRRTEGGLEFIPGGPADPAQAGRLAAAKGDDVTPAQLANNREINEARKRLREIEQKLEPGVSLTEEIHRRIGTTDPATGRTTLDFNTFLGRTAWMAMQHKVGQDQEQARWSKMLINPPAPVEPVEPEALPPAAEEPGILDRLGDYIFGDDEPRPAGEDGPRRGRRRGGGRARGRGGAKAISKMSITDLDDIISQRGDNLSPADLKAIQARLAALGK